MRADVTYSLFPVHCPNAGQYGVDAWPGSIIQYREVRADGSSSLQYARVLGRADVPEKAGYLAALHLSDDLAFGYIRLVDPSEVHRVINRENAAKFLAWFLGDTVPEEPALVARLADYGVVNARSIERVPERIEAFRVQSPDPPAERIQGRAQADNRDVAWKLPQNDIWNLPDEVAEVRAETLLTAGPFASIISYRAVAVDSNGGVYGVRTLSRVSEDGYTVAGKVSIGGKKYRGFSSSQLFEREDGSLCDVAVIRVCLG